jgi:hypothetical protein
MTFFTIAAIQMPISAVTENVSAMQQQLDSLMRRFPAVRMVIFSELCAYGPAKALAQA